MPDTGWMIKDEILGLSLLLTLVSESVQIFYFFSAFESLRVCVEISSQIFRVQAPAQQGTKMQKYLAYVEFSQRS